MATYALENKDKRGRPVVFARAYHLAGTEVPHAHVLQTWCAHKPCAGAVSDVGAMGGHQARRPLQSVAEVRAGHPLLGSERAQRDKHKL